MTETYNGDWNPVIGDKPGKRVEDPYHPIWPDVNGDYQPRYSDSKPAGVLNSPMSGAYKTRLWGFTVAKGNGN